jgi:hypothetical protein
VGMLVWVICCVEAFIEENLVSLFQINVVMLGNELELQTKGEKEKTIVAFRQGGVEFLHPRPIFDIV